MARYKKKDTNTLFIEGTLDSLLPPDSVARTIMFALDKLDFSTYEKCYSNDETGCTAINPKTIMAIWVLAILRGTNSSLVLERLCQTDIEFRWLLNGVQVKKSTLCEFRTSRLAQLEEISFQILASLGEAGLLPARQAGLDGTVISAAAACSASKKRGDLVKARKKLQEKIAIVLARIEESPDEKVTLEKIQKHQAAVEAAIEKMNQRKMEEEGDRLTLTEEDALYMRKKDRTFGPARNIQVVSDLDSGVIIHAEVVNQGGDGGLLEPQIKGAKLALEEVGTRLGDGSKFENSLKEVVADGAYHDTKQMVALLADGIMPCVPDSRMENRKIPMTTEEFQANKFIYDEKRDIMVCPAGKFLTRRKINPGNTGVIYQAKSSECDECPQKLNCCPKTENGRNVTRKIYQEEMNTIKKFIDTPKGWDLRKKRQTTVEGNMGRLKVLLNWERMSCWNEAGAKAELKLRQIIANLVLLVGRWKPLVYGVV